MLNARDLHARDFPVYLLGNVMIQIVVNQGTPAGQKKQLSEDNKIATNTGEVYTGTHNQPLENGSQSLKVGALQYIFLYSSLDLAIRPLAERQTLHYIPSVLPF